MLKSVLLSFFLLLSFCAKAQSFTTVFERSKGDSSATYHQTIAYYQTLVDEYKQVAIKSVGPTDAPYPLHVVLYTPDGNLNIKDWHQENRIVILINNGIHPGEPDGIDASMMLLRDALKGKIKVPDNIALAIIPIYNIGGALNRNSHSRANQNGPASYGFRGNTKNLDLNRDFIKMDAKETRTLVRLFHMLDPDIFIDNHVSNGADYQYTVTLLATEFNKLGGSMGKFMNETLTPLVFKDMKEKGQEMIPYVNVWGRTPDTGWPAFIETPRFASGFGALFQSYSFVTETHMLKPYKNRVVGTYELMKSFIKVTSTHADELKQSKLNDRKRIVSSTHLPISWQLDTTRSTPVQFKGYEGIYKASEVSGKERLFYDRKRPYSKTVPYYNYYKPSETVKVPKSYIIRQAWSDVVEKLRVNNVLVKKMPRDTVIELGVYYIEDYKTTKSPYEGHYLHSNVKVHKEVKKINVYKGDFIINTRQKAKRYIVETLEPAAPDAFFAWGFFDGILQQKEHFSPYVFEEVANDLLESNEVLRDMLEKAKSEDSTLANNGYLQLNFIYKHSPYYELSHKQYPVYRLE